MWMRTAWSSFCHRQTLYSAYRQLSVSWGSTFLIFAGYRLMFEALPRLLKQKTIVWQNYGIFSGTLKAQTFSFGFTRFPWLNNSQEEAVNKVMHAKDVPLSTASRNWKDHHAGRPFVGNLPPGKPSDGMRSKQYGCRLD